MTAALLLVISLMMILACGVFVAAEFAFVTVDRTQVSRAAEAGDRRAAGVQQALRTLSTQLSGAQVGITVTNLAIGFLAEPAIAALIEDPLTGLGVPAAWVPGVAVAVGLTVSTALTIIFGELVPKNLAIARPYETAIATQRFSRTFTTINAIPIRFLNGSANAIVRRLGLEPQEELRSARSSQELASLIAHSGEQGTLDADTAELMERSVTFGTRTAGEIMTPRVRTHSVEVGDRAQVVTELASSTGHSRFPVLDGEEVVGTVHLKHAVALPLADRATTRVKHILNRPIVVPDSLRLDPLLALLRADGFQLAVVLDEYGGFAGIVTLEDVVEEIVGDISDEHDRRGNSALRLRDGWSLSGLLRPDEVADLTGVELPAHEDYDTIAGLMLRALGRVPQPGDTARIPLPDVAEEPTRRPSPGGRGGPYRHGQIRHGQIRHAQLRVARMEGLRIDRLTLRVVEQGPVEQGVRADG